MRSLHFIIDIAVAGSDIDILSDVEITEGIVELQTRRLAGGISEPKLRALWTLHRVRIDRLADHLKDCIASMTKDFQPEA